MNTADKKPWHLGQSSFIVLTSLTLKCKHKRWKNLFPRYSPQGHFHFTFLFFYFFSYFYFLNNIRSPCCCFYFALFAFSAASGIYVVWTCFRLWNGWAMLFFSDGGSLWVISVTFTSADMSSQEDCLQGELFCVQKLVPEHMYKWSIITHILWIFSLPRFWHICISMGYRYEFFCLFCLPWISAEA